MNPYIGPKLSSDVNEAGKVPFMRNGKMINFVNYCYSMPLYYTYDKTLWKLIWGNGSVYYEPKIVYVLPILGDWTFGRKRGTNEKQKILY